MVEARLEPYKLTAGSMKKSFIGAIDTDGGVVCFH
jgi:hypothetical protein